MRNMTELRWAIQTIIILFIIFTLFGVCFQERPYLCGMCGATFTCSIHLQQHSLVHTSQSPGGATHPVAVTLASVVATLTNSRCDESASNKRGNSLSTVLPSSGSNVNHGNANDENASTVSQRGVTMTECTEMPSYVTESGATPQQLPTVTSIAVFLPGSALATSSATSADETRCPASAAMVTDNRTSETPSVLGNKRRCLQRQCAMSGDEVAMTTVETLPSTDGSCIVTAAVDDIANTKRSNTLEHSDVGHDPAEICSSTVTWCVTPSHLYLLMLLSVTCIRVAKRHQCAV